MEQTPIAHIRSIPPRKGGNSFYRDHQLGYTPTTLCGADVTEFDIANRTAHTKAFRASQWAVCDVCAACIKETV